MPFDKSSPVKTEPTYLPEMTDADVSAALLQRKIEIGAGVALVLLVVIAFLYRRQIAHFLYEAATTIAALALRCSRLVASSAKTFGGHAKHKADRT